MSIHMRYVVVLIAEYEMYEHDDLMAQDSSLKA